MFLHFSFICENDEIKWKDEFKGELFSFHGKNYSCVLAMCFDGFKRKETINKVSGNSVQGRNNLSDQGGRSLPKISVKNP